MSEALETANCVKSAENLGYIKYEGRSCVEQTGFYGSDYSPVLLTFEPYWIARVEANKKALQAIAAADFASRLDNVDMEALFNDDDDDMLPATYNVYDEAAAKVPDRIKKARARQQFRHQRDYSHHLHGALGALTVMNMLTMASLLAALPTLDKNEAHGATAEYWATHKTGEIVLPDGAEPLLAETLFDTGCEHFL